MEDVQILRFAVEGADSISDLKDNIRELKKQIEGYTEVIDGNKVKIEGLKIGTDEYKQALKELEENQAALRNAMHGTATSMEQVAAAAKGQDQSYNGLVRTMAIYKEELRAIDTSTVEGTEAFKNKARQIDAVNSKLKALDEMQGNYQRNVGNYKSAIEGLSGAFKATAGSAAGIISPLTAVTGGLKALSATPAIAILGLLANVLNKVMEGLKSSEQNTMAMQKALAVFQPILNATTNALQTMAGWLVKIVEGAGKAARWLGLVKGDAADAMQALTAAEQQLILDQREMQVYESRVQADIAKLQADAADRTNKTAAERKKAAEEAQRLSEELFNKQYELAQRDLDLQEQRAALTQNDAATNEKLVAAKVKLNNLDRERAQRQRAITQQESSAVSELSKQVNTASETSEKAAKKTLKTWADFEKERKSRESNYKLWTDEITKDIETEFQSITEDVTALLGEYEEAQWAAIEIERKAEAERQRIQKERLASFMGYTSTLSDLSGAIADIYEADADADEAAAKKAKGFKIASAILSTINGAVSAFTSTWSAAELPLSVKAVLAPMNAAAVLAAGYAQVKQMNSVKVGNDSSSAAVPAPAFSPYVAQVRNVTGQREEERLYQNQRVFLVYSDLEIANTAHRVKVRETEF